MGRKSEQSTVFSMDQNISFTLHGCQFAMLLLSICVQTLGALVAPGWCVCTTLQVIDLETQHSLCVLQSNDPFRGIASIFIPHLLVAFHLRVTIADIFIPAITSLPAF